MLLPPNTEKRNVRKYLSLIAVVQYLMITIEMTDICTPRYFDEAYILTYLIFISWELAHTTGSTFSNDYKSLAIVDREL